MTAPTRYVIPGDVVLAMAVNVSQAFEGLRLAALAAAHPLEAVPDALETTLAYVATRLETIHETLFAVVGEQPGEPAHGPERAC